MCTILSEDDRSRDRAVRFLRFAVFTVILLAAAAATAQTEQPDEPATELVLSDALEKATAEHEDLEIARQQIERSRALRREVFARMLPSVSGTLSGSLNGPEVEVAGRVVTQQWSWGGSLTGRLVLFDGSLYPAYSETGELLRASERERDWVEHTLAFEVEQAFHSLAAAQKALEVAERTVELREAYLKRTEALSRQGIALPIDAARARNQFLVARQALLEAENRLRNLADALAVLLVMETDGTIRVRLEGEPPAPESADSSARADIDAQRDFLASLEDRRSSVWWSLFPTVDLSATGRAGPPSFNAPDGFSWAISLNLNWLLYDGGARYARMDAIEAEAEASRLRIQGAERNARADQVRAFRDWETSYEAIDVARENVEVTREAYDMALARFEAGLATTIEVNEASEQLVLAEQALVTAELESRLSESQYRYVLGIVE